MVPSVASVEMTWFFMERPTFESSLCALSTNRSLCATLRTPLDRIGKNKTSRVYCGEFDWQVRGFRLAGLAASTLGTVDPFVDGGDDVGVEAIEKAGGVIVGE
jgi:hypothetical protein